MNTQNLLVELFGKNILPIFNASGTFDPLCEQNQILATDFGAYVAKTVTLNPEKGNKPPRIVEISHNGASLGLINSIGLQNDGFDDLLQNKLSRFKELGAPVIISVAGDIGDLFSIFQKIKKSSEFLKIVFALELNISCPNISKAFNLLHDMVTLCSFIMTHKRLLPGLPLILKLPPVENIVEIAQTAESGGVDAISLVNTFKAMDIDIATRRSKLGNIFGGYSSPAILPMALYNVWQVARAVKIPIIGMGGISCWQDAVKMFFAGTRVISIGITNFGNLNSAKEIKAGILNYLAENNLTDINQIIGKLKE